MTKITGKRPFFPHKIMLFLLCIHASATYAQFQAGKEGLHIAPGTLFSSDGLYLNPSEAMLFNDNGLVKRSLSVSGSQLNGIRKIYQFAKPVPFKGTLGLFYYEDELNGNQADDLRLAYSSQLSTLFGDYSMFEEDINDRKLGLLKNQASQIPILSNITALTPPGKLLPNGNVAASNFLTPNQDGLNDFWVIKGIENYPLNELKIYDRSGRLIYNTTNYDNTWDGTFNGRPLAEDSYYYILYLVKEQKQITGFVSIVKTE